MSMVIEKEVTPSGDVCIKRIDGILPRGCLPKEYLNSGPRVFSVIKENPYYRSKKNTTVVVLDDDENTPNESRVIAKLRVGKVIPFNVYLDEILPVICAAGNRLHDMRKVDRESKNLCTDIF